MLTVVALILIAWLVGLLTSMTAGGWIHLLPVVAAGLLIARLVQIRRRQMG